MGRFPNVWLNRNPTHLGTHCKWNGWLCWSLTWLKKLSLRLSHSLAHRARLMIKGENGTGWTEARPLVADLRVLNMDRTILVSAGRPRGLVFVVAVWTMGLRTVLDWTSLVDAARWPVSIVASKDISNRIVPSWKEVRGRAVEIQERRPKANQPQHRGCMDCHETTEFPDLLIRSLAISKFIFLHSSSNAWSGT